MKVVVGLGNPGKEYEKTRHNVGFLALDELAKRNNFPAFQLESKFKAQISVSVLNGEKVLLVKPITFMNLSGEAIALLRQFYKFEVSDVLIVYDDKDMEFGKLRFRSEGSSGGHNGIKSLIACFGSETFDRLKIGVGDSAHPAYKRDASAFVLGNFSPEEMKKLGEVVLFDVCEKVEEWLI